MNYSGNHFAGGGSSKEPENKTGGSQRMTPAAIVPVGWLNLLCNVLDWYHVQRHSTFTNSVGDGVLPWVAKEVLDTDFR